MEKAYKSLSQNHSPSTDVYSKGHKRIKLLNDGDECSTTVSPTGTFSEEKRQNVSSEVADHSNPFVVANVVDQLGRGKYGSVTKIIEEVFLRRSQVLGPYLKDKPSSHLDIICSRESSSSKDAPRMQVPVIDLEDSAPKVAPAAITPIVILDSDEEDNEDIKLSVPFEEDNRSDKPASLLQEIVMENSVGEPFIEVMDHWEGESQGATTPLLESDTNRDKGVHVGVKAKDENAESEALDDGQNRSQLTALLLESDTNRDKGKGVHVVEETEENVEGEDEDDDQKSGIQGSDMDRDKGVYVGVNEEEEEEEEENTESETEDDGLGEIWNQMSLALEVSKDDFENPSFDEHSPENEEYRDHSFILKCDHSFILKDDLGYVCRVCGVIQKAIETIIDIQFNKVKSMRTYMHTSRNAKYKDLTISVGLELLKEDFDVTGISAHPRHLKQMKPHQMEGFKFLCGNLMAENPGGCILAHAPGSGKTFMILSFVQSFLAKYPHGRPLVVLPKGILQTWKKEFLKWQIEDIPLLDLYSEKAESRAQQLEVLKRWVDQKSILFLGYKQFSTIVCDDGKNNAAVNCQTILLSRPSILILDEGHTPRNEDTEVLQSLAKVHTPRKVVLSGTLYQNHVKEVFNVLNLVRPKFLKSDTSRSIMKRIMSKVHIPSGRKQFRGDLEAAFFEMVEHTIQRDDDFRRKVAVIQDLREMMSKVLHYYKGDFLDELPGLVDFTVMLNLTTKQKDEVSKLNKLLWKFKRTSVGSAVYLHPELNSFSENSSLSDFKMDELLENIDCKDGVKAKFFLNMLNLCESGREKLLVFSQYLPPLKFLERLVMKAKGWSLGREVFVISGESSTEQRECAMEHFNNSSDAKVFFGSIKACGEGISLVGASRVIILDVHLNPSVTRQAIGRAFRPGQKKKVYVYRLVAGDSPEEEDHRTCFKKEAIAKMWFEWNEYCGYKDFEMENVELSECGDLFLESSLVRADIRALYRR